MPEDSMRTQGTVAGGRISVITQLQLYFSPKAWAYSPGISSGFSTGDGMRLGRRPEPKLLGIGHSCMLQLSRCTEYVSFWPGIPGSRGTPPQLPLGLRPGL